MGYTHYWKSAAFTAAQWEKLAAGARSVLSAASAAEIHIAMEFSPAYDEPGQLPVVDDNCLRFNGTGKGGHETFVLTRAPMDFGFCKTAQKPYDAAVVAILILASECGPLTWSSDGEEEDWAAGRELLAASRGDKDLDPAPVSTVFVNDIEVTALQAEAVRSVYRRPVVGYPRTFEKFTEGLAPMIGGGGAVVLPWCGMMLAIEPDGHVHS